MSRMVRSAGIVLFVLVALLADVLPSSVVAQDATPPPIAASGGAVAASEIRVSDQRPIAIPGRIYALSPDGRWIAGSGGGESGLDALCVYPMAAPLTAHACVDLPANGVGRIDYERVSWSPDSTRLAFTEDGPRTFVDADVWVFAAETGELANLTDDAIAGAVRSSGDGDDQEPFAMDFLPAWTPDGQEIAFVRSAWRDGEWQGTRVMRVPAAGGEAVELLLVTRDEPFAVYFRMAYTPDGQRLIFTRTHAAMGNPSNGLWSVDRDGDSPRHLAGAVDPEGGYPILVEMSPLGDTAIVLDLRTRLRNELEEPFALVDLQDGTSEPLTLLGPDVPEYSFIRYATFSPDGTKVLCRSAPFEHQLLVRDLGGADEYALLDLPEVGAIDDLDGVFWLTNGTIFSSTDIDEGVLLTVEPQLSRPSVQTEATPAAVRAG